MPVVKVRRGVTFAGDSADSGKKRPIRTKRAVMPNRWTSISRAEQSDSATSASPVRRTAPVAGSSLTPPIIDAHGHVVVIADAH